VKTRHEQVLRLLGPFSGKAISAIASGNAAEGLLARTALTVAAKSIGPGKFAISGFRYWTS